MTDHGIAKPKLYLDVDGVLLPFTQPSDTNLPFEVAALNSLEFYSPEVVRRLGKTCFNVVWCTTWSTVELEPLKEAMNITASSRLQLPRLSEGLLRISDKLEAVISDQAREPSPFAWADDDINDEIMLTLAGLLQRRDYLLVRPDRSVGINETQLRDIETFAHLYE